MTTQPTSEMIEAVARGLYDQAQAEARAIDPRQRLPTYEEDCEDSREMCRRMAKAAIAAMGEFK